MSRRFPCAVVFGAMLGSTTGQDNALVHVVEQAPVAITKIATGVFLVDFGRVAFGNLSLTPVNEQTTSDALTVRFGEAFERRTCGYSSTRLSALCRGEGCTERGRDHDCCSSSGCAQYRGSRRFEPSVLGGIDSVSLGRGGGLAG